jgi:hypothetical protein
MVPLSVIVGVTFFFCGAAMLAKACAFYALPTYAPFGNQEALMQELVAESSLKPSPAQRWDGMIALIAIIAGDALMRAGIGALPALSPALAQKIVLPLALEGATVLAVGLMLIAPLLWDYLQLCWSIRGLFPLHRPTRRAIGAMVALVGGGLLLWESARLLALCETLQR